MKQLHEDEELAILQWIRTQGGRKVVSRSYRHAGWIMDQTCKRFGKRYSNHVVRRSADVPSGRAYRKFYESYNVCDYILQARPKGSSPDAYRDWMK